MAASTRSARRRLRLVARKQAPPRLDFGDSSSQRVLDQGARELLRTAARAAADEYFDRVMGLQATGGEQ